MPKSDRFPMPGATDEPSFVPTPAAKSTTEAPTNYGVTDIRAMPNYPDDDRLRWSQHQGHPTFTDLSNRPTIAAPAQTTTSSHNAVLSVPGAKPDYTERSGAHIPPAMRNSSARGFSSLNMAARPASCSYCGKEGHSDEVCRRKKREVGCIMCGVKGHLEHQCGQASGRQCLYCLKIGHTEPFCHTLTRDMTPCQFCHRLGHPADRCFRKRDLPNKEDAANTPLSATIPPFASRLGSRRDGDGSRGTFGFDAEPQASVWANAPNWNHTIEEPTADSSDGNNGHQALNIHARRFEPEKATKSTSSQPERGAERAHAKQATTYALTDKGISTSINKVKPGATEAKNIILNFRQRPPESNEGNVVLSQGSHEFVAFQQRLMKDRCEEAMRMQRERNHGHS